MAATQVRGACVREDVGVQIPPWAQVVSVRRNSSKAVLEITPSLVPTLRS